MSGLKLMGALSPLKLLQSTNNVLQPLQETQNNDTNKNRNQNLLKAVNVTSARADSTGTENSNNFSSVSSGPTKGAKKARGRGLKQMKNSEPLLTSEKNKTKDTGKPIRYHRLISVKLKRQMWHIFISIANMYLQNGAQMKELGLPR